MARNIYTLYAIYTENSGLNQLKQPLSVRFSLAPFPSSLGTLFINATEKVFFFLALLLQESCRSRSEFSSPFVWPEKLYDLFFLAIMTESKLRVKVKKKHIGEFWQRCWKILSQVNLELIYFGAYLISFYDRFFYYIYTEIFLYK